MNAAVQTRSKRKTERAERVCRRFREKRPPGLDDDRSSHRSALNMVKASILVLTKNGMPDVARCLKAVYSQRTTNAKEVIVVDSGSTDETLEIARGFQVRLEQIPPASFHHARTRNFAAGLARGEILVFLSQDAIPDFGSVAGLRWSPISLIQALERSTDDRCLGPIRLWSERTYLTQCTASRES